MRREVFKAERAGRYRMRSADTETSKRAATHEPNAVPTEVLLTIFLGPMGIALHSLIGPVRYSCIRTPNGIGTFVRQLSGQSERHGRLPIKFASLERAREERT